MRSRAVRDSRRNFRLLPVGAENLVARFSPGGRGGSPTTPPQGLTPLPRVRDLPPLREESQRQDQLDF
jgi:hypothetical protein